MKIKSILAFAAAMALSFAAHAHDCSGGVGGGMDATGNQCNDESAYSAVLVTAMPTAGPAAQLSPRNVVSGAIKTVATSAASATPRASQRAPKKYSQRATTKAKKEHATAG